jgi:iron complex outermembrane recepter protein
MASAADSPGNSSTENSSAEGLQEIVVTAQKREERLQDVPVSISALTGEDLVKRNLTQLTDYAAYLPGLNIVNGGTPGFTTITLRGIANVGEQTPSVGTYMDDTPVGSSSGWGFGASTQLDLPPYDLDRIELLRGPQGTLYGAGTTGGLLKYVLKSPSTDQFEAKVGADLETIDGASNLGTQVRAMVNMPLSSNMALLVDGYDTRTPGYIDNAYNGTRDVNSFREAGGRVAFLWRPTDDITVKLNALEFWSRADGLNWETYTKYAPVPNSGVANIVSASQPLGNLVQSTAFAQPVTRNFNIYTSTIDWNPGPVDVLSSTSWSKQEIAITRDFTQNFAPLYPLFNVPVGLNLFTDTEDLHKFTQEVRIASPQKQTLEWLVGFFYTDEKSELNEFSTAYDNNYQPIPAFQPYFFSAVLPTIYDERAAFADVTWHITDSFDIGGGARYSHNNQNFYEILGGLLTGNSTTRNGASQGDPTWAGDVRYHFTPDTMAYARVATGYNPGGPNGVGPTANVPSSYGPETLVSYEVGVKSEFLDRRALIDATVFRINWHNIQLGEVTAQGLGYTGNGGEAVSKGVEWTSSYSPLRGLTFGYNAAFTQAEITSVAANITGGILTGYQLPLIPKWAMSGTAAYDWTLPNAWVAHVGLGVHWVDVQWSGVVAATAEGGAPVLQLPSQTSADLDASLLMGKLRLKAYVRNLNNERALQAATFLPTQVQYSIAQPRTIGVGFDQSF